jgi:hypothetical protein
VPDYVEVDHKAMTAKLVRVPALQIVADRGCTCQVCYHVWPPDLYTHLARVLGCGLPQGVLEAQ